MRRLISKALAASLAALLVASAAAFGQVCRSAGPDSMHVYILETAKQYALATDPYWTEARDSLKIPSLAARDIALETRESICKSAEAAYRAAVQGQGSGLTGRVYVVKLGSTKYLVWDPGYVDDPQVPHYLHMVQTSKFAVVSKF